MQSKFTAIVLAMLLAVSAFAVEDTGNASAQSKGWDDTFTKFSMGVMLGIGPSYLKGAGEYYDAEKTTGISIMFEMAYPITDNMALRAELGFDGIFGIGSTYQYVHREVKDSVSSSGFEIALYWNMFLSENFFVNLGPAIRFPWFKEIVEIEDEKIFSGEPEYGNDLWLDAVLGVGFKIRCIEFGFRGGYELLGFYKETKKYRKVDIHELRFRFYFMYWFGQKRS